MAILLALVTFLLFIAISYLLGEKEARVEVLAPRPAKWKPLPQPAMVAESGVEMPKGYRFHIGHAWALEEGRETARLGIDGFAANLMGKIERIELPRLNRWVEQGQKIWTVVSDGVSLDMLSPVGGVVVGINPAVEHDPNLITADPYHDGWICAVKAPDLNVHRNNLLQGPLVGAWMKDSLERLVRLASLSAPAPQLLQDGGMPVPGLLGQLEPEVRRRIISEIFLT